MTSDNHLEECSVYSKTDIIKVRSSIFTNITELNVLLIRLYVLCKRIGVWFKVQLTISQLSSVLCGMVCFLKTLFILSRVVYYSLPVVVVSVFLFFIGRLSLAQWQTASKPNAVMIRLLSSIGFCCLSSVMFSFLYCFPTSSDISLHSLCRLVLTASGSLHRPAPRTTESIG